MSYLREGDAVIKALKDERLEIVELCALGQMKAAQAHEAGNKFELAAWVVKYGCPKFREMSVDQIMESMSLDALQEIAEAVTDLSDLDAAKNSESTPGEDSSSP